MALSVVAPSPDVSPVSDGLQEYIIHVPTVADEQVAITLQRIAGVVTIAGGHVLDQFGSTARARVLIASSVRSRVEEQLQAEGIFVTITSDSGNLSRVVESEK